MTVDIVWMFVLIFQLKLFWWFNGGFGSGGGGRVFFLGGFV